jgi:hypothetical protein
VGSGSPTLRMATPLVMDAYGGSDVAVWCLVAEHGVGIDRVSVQCFTALVVAAMWCHLRRCEDAVVVVDVRCAKQLWRPLWRDGAGLHRHGHGHGHGQVHGQRARCA